jgi:AAA+ superfamily predicted ATPase
MLIHFLNGQTELIKKKEVDFDWLMTEAENMSGDPFVNAIAVIENKALSGGIQINENSRLNVIQYLNEYAAYGFAKEPLMLTVESVKGKGKQMIQVISKSFEEVIELPNREYKERFDRLVGLDELKNHIQKEAAIIVAPEMLKNWCEKFHQKPLKVLDAFNDRYPFFIFEGDVGTGKTEFATTFGASLADFTGKMVLLARMSMKSRGNGVVGEMSKLISSAFQEASELANSHNSPVILLLDEADSLAQSREESQMHHEDRAGVNALIQGIDHIRYSSVPVLVVFCTNRLGSIDPAIRRRAALIHTFSRPNFKQRLDVLRNYYSDVQLNESELITLANMTGDNEVRSYGFSYSDLITRVIPHSVLSAYPNKGLSFDIIREAITVNEPTPPFNELGQKE